MVAPLNEPFLSIDGDVRLTSIFGASMPDQCRIVVPGMNKDISSRDDALSVRSDVGKLDKLDTAVHQSSTNKRNTAPSRIEEGSLESICPKIFKE